MRERLIKVKVDSKVYDTAKQYGINIEDYLAKQLQTRINEISIEIAEQKRGKELHEQTQELV
jgi:hypothetical protein